MIDLSYISTLISATYIYTIALLRVMYIRRTKFIAYIAAKESQFDKKNEKKKKEILWFYRASINLDARRAYLPHVKLCARNYMYSIAHSGC